MSGWSDSTNARPGPPTETALDRLLLLCPCKHNGACMDAEQACPVHGDGVTFVAYVRTLEAVADAAQVLHHLQGRAS